MRAEALYDLLRSNFPELQIKDIENGKSLFWKVVRGGSSSTRIVRVHEDSQGNVNEVKLSVSSLTSKTKKTIPWPASESEICEAIRQEVALLEGRG